VLARAPSFRKTSSGPADLVSLALRAIRSSRLARVNRAFRTRQQQSVYAAGRSDAITDRSRTVIAWLAW